MTLMPNKEIKVFWKLEQDEDEWPPFADENIWCTEIDPNIFKLLNVPYFAKGVAWGDVVFVRKKKGVLWFDAVKQRSGYATVHVMSFDEQKSQQLLAWAKDNDCVAELAFDGTYFALGIPPKVPRETWWAFLKGLESLEDDGLEFEIACDPTVLHGSGGALPS